MAGTLKVGGVPIATHSDATAKVSLDSGLIFPAGHILQHKFNTCGLTNGANITTTSTSKQLICTINFTKIHSTSRVLLKTFGTVYKNNTATGNGVRIYLIRTSPTAQNLTPLLWTDGTYTHTDADGDAYMWGAYTASADNQINMISGLYFDDDDISSQITYSMYYSSSTSGQGSYIYPNVGFEVLELKT